MPCIAPELSSAALPRDTDQKSLHPVDGHDGGLRDDDMPPCSAKHADSAAYDQHENVRVEFHLPLRCLPVKAAGTIRRPLAAITSVESGVLPFRHTVRVAAMLSERRRAPRLL